MSYLFSLILFKVVSKKSYSKTLQIHGRQVGTITVSIIPELINNIMQNCLLTSAFVKGG